MFKDIIKDSLEIQASIKNRIDCDILVNKNNLSVYTFESNLQVNFLASTMMYVLPNRWLGYNKGFIKIIYDDFVAQFTKDAPIKKVSSQAFSLPFYDSEASTEEFLFEVNLSIDTNIDEDILKEAYEDFQYFRGLINV